MSGVVYDRRVQGKALSFGVSGRLYQSNVLFYDHQTESLWSQIKEEAVTGPLTGTHLHALPSVTTSWADWHRMHPQTLVLSLQTGYRRDYGRDPYAGYHTSQQVMFPLRHPDRRLPAKAKVFGLHIGTVSKAYPLARLVEVKRVDDELAGRRVRVEFDTASARATAVLRDSHEPLAGIVGYWFAWSAFHPDTAVWGVQPAAQTTPKSSKVQSPGGSAQGSGAVAVVDHSAYWTDLFMPGVAGLGGEDDSGKPALLVIRGTIRNTSGHTLDHVKLTYELLRTNGEVVASESGYNRGAEVLRPVDSPVPVHLKELPVTPIPQDGSDTFRMVFLRAEIPAFDSYRVRVVEAAVSHQ